MGEPERSSSRWRPLLQLGISVLLIAGLVYVVGGIELPPIVSVGWILASLGLFVVSEAVATGAWGVYFGDRQASWWSLFQANQASHVSSLILPSPTPSLTRPLFLPPEEELGEVLGSTIIERINVLSVYGLALVLAAGALTVLVSVGTFVFLTAAAGLGLLAGSLWLHTLLARRRRSANTGSGWFGRTLRSLGGLAQASAHVTENVIATGAQMARDRRRVVSGLGLQILAIVVLHGALGLALAYALAVPGPLWAFFILPTAANALAILPGLPRGLGAVEGAGTALFVAAGVSAGPALTFLLAHRAITIIGVLLLGGPAVLKTGLGAIRDVAVPEDAGGDRLGR